MGKRGIPKFLVGWEDLPDEADTWEPIEHLPGSEDLIKEFRIAEKKRISKLEQQLEAAKTTKKRRFVKDAASSETGA
ncbi:hypothetical protein CYMTET_5237 [Cymbomonas tetramitiformis]|uniref:Chromo domain-containing protein n=1 Tax=Cymbomonas tetramitiformis TaxID=36881 RepID=A0AAE0GZQ3_9CHLO|nr:hypothetical protein CYMTET_5237 [Cymbomonas tetramitiformis]